MSYTDALKRRAFGETMRSDAWWVQPLVVFLGLGAFVVYSTWAAFQGEHYAAGPYLSPFYSPEVFGDIPLKERVVDRFYDPLRRLLALFRK